MAQERRQKTSRPFGGIIAILIFALIIFLLFQMAKGIFTILSFLAPILFILALIFNHNVVLDYGKMLLNKLKTDTPKGILYTILSVVGFPFVSTFLFFKAFVTSKFKKAQDEKKEFDQYEDITEEDDEDFLDLPELEKDIQTTKQKPSRESNNYDDLFTE